ncbi:hypothetical protein MLD38_000863 [Melastoma candidum]|uniref:Uncharacterized protein n=1 Tax=Melastoma candidum TaxID=119954 RepID=A0ACB9SBH7_9MYRT|nr:hypothetical protein MLD38_000863 [Melastoma candidum]
MLGSFSSTHDDHDDPDRTTSSSSDLLYLHYHQSSPSLPQPVVDNCSPSAFVSPPPPPPTTTTAMTGTATATTTTAAAIQPTSMQMRQLLVTTAELLERSNFSAAHRLLTLLTSSSSPFGDSTDRLLHQFSHALSLRLHRLSSAVTTMSYLPHYSNNNNIISAGVFSFGPGVPSCSLPGTRVSPRTDTDSLQSCYLSLNQVTPFIRFSHLTANQAILDAIEGENSVHILDLDIMHGVQWPPLMQVIAERKLADGGSDDNSSARVLPRTIQITGCGRDLGVLRRTGDRLSRFAQSLGLTFEFHPLLVTCETDPILLREISSVPSQALAVNCPMCLHRQLRDDSRDLCVFLRRIKSLRPKVVTVAEREGNNNSPSFLRRFAEAIEHYTAIFESLEATLPPSSRERLEVEEVWFGREIRDIVAEEGALRKERHERFECWESFLRSSGFSNVPLSPFALSQAKLLLRLHYPSEGYQLQFRKNAAFLGWQARPLFSVSSWR